MLKKIIFSLTMVFALTFGTLNVSAAQIVVLGPNNEVVVYKEFEAKNDDAFSALKKTGVRYVDEGDKYPQYPGSYVTSIGGLGMSKTNGWVYTVNGISPNVAASEYKINDDSQIIWCAYNNVDNIEKYSFPKPEKAYKNKETSQGSKPSSSSKPSTSNENKTQEDKIIDEIIGELNIEEEPEEKVEEKEINKTEDIKEDEHGEDNYDVRNLGYIGLVICFILSISYFRYIFSKGEENKNE